jgi:hypothetical protein
MFIVVSTINIMIDIRLEISGRGTGHLAQDPRFEIIPDPSVVEFEWSGHLAQDQRIPVVPDHFYLHMFTSAAQLVYQMPRGVLIAWDFLVPKRLLGIIQKE